MTKKELVEFLNNSDIPDDYIIRVRASGGFGPATPIEKISLGFDWDMKSVVLHPHFPLQRVITKKKVVKKVKGVVKKKRPISESLEDKVEQSVKAFLLPKKKDL